MKRKQAAAAVFAEPKQEAASVLDQVIAATEQRGPVARPGWSILPAGVVRKLPVNRMFIAYGACGGRIPNLERPFLVEEDGKETAFEEVEVAGSVAFKTAEISLGCSVSRSAWIETTAALYVK